MHPERDLRMSTEPTPGKTSEPLTLHLVLGDRLTYTGYVPPFEIMDGEPKDSIVRRYSALTEAITLAIYPLVEKANAEAEEFAEYIKEERAEYLREEAAE